MNYIGDAIEFLKNYVNLEKAVDNLETDIKEINADLKVGQIGAIEYNDMPTGSSTQLPGDDIINKMYILQVKRREYALTKKTLERMDRIMSGLPELDQKILKAWYIEGLRGDTVFNHTGCSERNFFRRKNDALKTFAIQIHGINAV